MSGSEYLLMSRPYFHKPYIYKSYGLKKQPPSYDVWVELNNTIVTVQSFTREIIIACTDPDAETAVKFQSFIERGIRQGMKAVLTDVN
jgi:hypothetical protein